MDPRIQALQKKLLDYRASKMGTPTVQESETVQTESPEQVNPRLQQFQSTLSEYRKSKQNGGKMFSNKPAKQEGGFDVGETVKSIVRAPATMIARPLQLAYELATPGDNFDEIDKFSKETLGGIVAPLPRDTAGLKKDIGRGIETVALGTGAPIAGGAAFGLGSSLEQGNDLLSAETVINTALGGVGGKALDVIGKPLFNAAGKVIGRITPDIVKDVASKGAGAVEKFAQENKLLGGVAAPLANTIEKGAQAIDTGIGKAANTAIVKPVKSIFPKSEGLMNKASGLSGGEVGRFTQDFGESPGAYLDRTGNFGAPEQIAKKEADKFVASIKQADEGFAKLPGNYKNEYVGKALDALAKREADIGVKGPQTKRIQELVSKYEKDGLNHSEINEVKRLYEKNVKLEFKKQNLSKELERATRIDNELRAWQDSEAKRLGFKNLPEINKQTRQSRFIMDKIYKKLAKDTGGSALDLGDMILLGSMSPESITIALARKLFKSPAVKARAARLFSNTEKTPFLKADIGAPEKQFQLPAKGQSSFKKPQSIFYTTPEGKTSTLFSEAVDAASRESGKVKHPEITKKGVEKLKKAFEQAQENLPYKEKGEMTAVEFGKLPKTKAGGIDISKLTPPQVINVHEFIKKAEPYIPENELPIIRF